MKPNPLSGPPVPLVLLLKLTALGVIVVGAHFTVNDPPETEEGGGHWLVLIEVKVALIDPLLGEVTEPVHDEKVTLTVAFSDLNGPVMVSAGLNETEPATLVHDTVPDAALPRAEATPAPVRATVPNDSDNAAPAIMNFRLSFT